MTYAESIRQIDDHMARAFALFQPAPQLIVERVDMDGNWWLNGMLALTRREITEADRDDLERAKDRIINRALGVAA